MKLRVAGVARFVVVTVGIVVLTSFTIDATDALRGSQSALSIFADRVTEGGCPSGMVKVGDRDLCVDTYEVSVGEDCAVAEPKSNIETARNVNDIDCVPESEIDAVPWRNVTLTQARALCARANKRLPSPEEWQYAALATPDDDRTCNVSGSLEKTGSSPSCRSGAGAFDMIGNVWELVNAEVSDRQYLGQSLPEEGYVETVSENGLARTTTSTPQVIYGEDYFWSNENGVYAVMRGGFHGSQSDAGIYTTHAAIAPNFSSGAIGFRCVVSL